MINSGIIFSKRKFKGFEREKEIIKARSQKLGRQSTMGLIAPEEETISSFANCAMFVSLSFSSAFMSEF